ncbi:hypothetical protein [Rufibacter sp. XAAS-G3-1]|uniref:hypothetical protein n=1 Tax=Rufibacter sp. XAAS-G3-1 TaxID=2729134 RepID=UPI0015E68A3E|nr:hypothetical protein [Rufibacter sp. XAAS-G3-1]
MEEVLAKARIEGKPVFIHLTLPDNPARNLPGNVSFTSALEDPAVVKAFNAQFLNVLVPRNTPQGSQLIRQFVVKQYPTYLYLSSDGNLIHRSTSNSSSPQKYLNDLKAFKEKAASTHNLSYFQKEFEQGRRTPDFLEQYLKLRQKMGLAPDLDLLETYVSQLPVSEFDKFSTVQFILEQGPVVESKAFVFSRSNQTILDSLYRSLPFSQRSDINNSIINNTMRKATATKDVTLAQKGAQFARTTWQQNYLRGQRAYQSNMVSYYKSVKDTANYLREAVNYYERYYMALSADSVQKIMAAEAERRNTIMPPSSKRKPAPTSEEVVREETAIVASNSSSFLLQLNNAAYSIYETGTQNPTYLTKAMLWSKRTVDLDPSAPFYDTLAHLLYRLQLYAEAEAMQQKAVDLASKANLSADRFKQGLQKIKARTL